MTRSRVAGKVALVTGAGSGIGRATAIAFAAEGAKVVLADINTAGNAETARLVGEHDEQHLALTCDVISSSDIQAVIEQTVDEFGRLDIAFNNAGIEQAPAPSSTSPRTSGRVCSTSTCAARSCA